MSDFEKMMFGDGNTTSTKPPSFLDDDTPPFLHNGDGKAVPSFLEGIGSPSAPATSASAASTNVVSSAERLQLVGETGVRWDLERVKILGKGSFGCATLYKQKDKTSMANRKWVPMVVVKDLNVQTMVDKVEEIKNIENEVRVMKVCDGHPSCTQFVDFINQSSSTKMMYIFLEFCSGGDLSHVIESQKNAGKMVPESMVASVLIQVSMGLYFLHNSKGILHRDMKPENVFLLEDKVTCRIGDFGISTILDSIGGSAKVACGSPFYMAPELLQESKYNYAVDVWSLGVLLYELVSLEKPFYSTNLSSLTTQIIQGKCIALHDRPGVGQQYSKELLDLIMSMLTVDAAVRPTMRRIIRSGYLKNNLRFVPQDVLRHPSYAEAFGAEVVTATLPHCVYKGCGGNPALKPPPAAAAAEEEYEDDFEDEESLYRARRRCRPAKAVSDARNFNLKIRPRDRCAHKVLVLRSTDGTSTLQTHLEHYGQLKEVEALVKDFVMRCTSTVMAEENTTSQDTTTANTTAKDSTKANTNNNTNTNNNNNNNNKSSQGNQNKNSGGNQGKGKKKGRK